MAKDIENGDAPKVRPTSWWVNYETWMVILIFVVAAAASLVVPPLPRTSAAVAFGAAAVIQIGLLAIRRKHNPEDISVAVWFPLAMVELFCAALGCAFLGGLW